MFIQCGFKKITIEDREIFEQYYSQMEGYWPSSICFDSMLAWNDSIVTYFREYEGYIICIAFDYVNNRYVCLPCIGKYEKETLTKAVEYCRTLFHENNIPFVITDVYQWMLEQYERLDNIKFKVIKDEGLSDYIYLKEDFAASLNKQDSRYNINYFIRKNNPEIKRMKESDLEECMGFIESAWCKSYNCQFCEYGCLKNVAKNIISEISKYNAKGIVVRVDGKIVGYCIVSVRKDEAIFHFKKTARNFRGINEVLHKVCFEEFCKEVRIINYTEDMNLEGLRKYKKRLAPYRLEPKYELCEINDMEAYGYEEN